MTRPILLTVRIDAMRHNVSVIRKSLGQSRIWAVAKANGYGQGIAQVVKGVADADGLAVLDLAEAHQARAAGWTKPILMLEGAFAAEDLAEMKALDASTVITSFEQAEMFKNASTVPNSLWIKLNTGMNRLGIPSRENHEALVGLVQDLSHRIQSPIHFMMHFACADLPTGWQSQFDEFQAAFAALKSRLTTQVGQASLANSAAVFGHPQTHADWARPGIALYGATPFEDESAEHSASGLGLKPVQSLTTQIIGIQALKPGDAVGYGARFRAMRPSRIGVIAAGYADGYPRCAPDGTPVWIAGRRVPIAGRVSMDLITVDLTDHPEVVVGSGVELWGEHLPIDDVARHCGTVGYELMTAVMPRVPRKIIDGQR
ncbi:MAG: alanine racemase [Betaproteobacteria bacterium]|nr:alanine racemase [Betaproteobacteria bacterium]